MSKILRFPLLILSLAGLAAVALGDTVTLKDGERIEGKITSETANDLTLEIQVSAGITDQRLLKKADVVKIDRIAPDETAYRTVMHLLPGKSSLSPAQYEGVVKALQGFTAQYPQSQHVSAVQRAILAFETDRKRVDAGEVKLEGTWLTKQEAQRQRVQIGGLQAFNAMKSANAAGDAIGALNAFAVLEKNFPGTKVIPEAIALARQILAALKPTAERALENSKISKIEREKGFADAGPADRVEMMAAFQRDQAKADAALASATTSGLWPPFYVSSEKCLAAIIAKVTPEAGRLETLPVAAMRESIQLAEKAGTEFANKELAAATETLKEVTKLWPANEMGIRLQAQVTEAKNPPKVEIATTPAPATPGTAKAGVATPAAKLPIAPTATDNPPPQTTATPAPVAPLSPTQTSEPAPPEEAPKPFFLTLGGAITIVIALAVILAAVNIFNKLRHRANDTLE